MKEYDTEAFIRRLWSEEYLDVMKALYLSEQDIDGIVHETGLPEQTVVEILDDLEDHRFIERGKQEN